jgi:hypothetical protein
MVSAEKQVPKKVYELPVLTVYGKVQELTRKIGVGGQPDGGRGLKSHTSLR